MSNYIVFDPTTGEIIRAGEAPDDQVVVQAQPGQSVIAVPAGVIAWPNLNLEPLKVKLRNDVDDQAGYVRSLFITDVPGQSQTYEKKEAEARTWSAGADQTAYPFIATESAVRGVPAAQVRDEIMAQVNQLTPLAALIEAHRVKAKTEVSAATTLPEIVQAAQVDWQALLPA